MTRRSLNSPKRNEDQREPATLYGPGVIARLEAEKAALDGGAARCPRCNRLFSGRGMAAKYCSERCMRDARMQRDRYGRRESEDLPEPPEAA